MSILEILEAHTGRTFDKDGMYVCQCGYYIGRSKGMGERHRAHVAQVIGQHERERCYEAWREGVATLDPDAVDIMEAANPYRDRS